MPDALIKHDDVSGHSSYMHVRELHSRSVGDSGWYPDLATVRLPPLGPQFCQMKPILNLVPRTSPSTTDTRDHQVLIMKP